MKKSKRLLTIILSLIMMVTIIGGTTISVSAATFKSGPYNVTKTFLATNVGGRGSTSYSGATAEYLVAIITTTKVNQNGTKITPDMDDAYAYNATSSGVAKVSCSGTGNKYTKVTCTHSAKYPGYSETSSNSSQSF